MVGLGGSCPLGRKHACPSLLRGPPRGGTKPTNASPWPEDEGEEREVGDLPVLPGVWPGPAPALPRTPAPLPLELGFGSPGPSVPFGLLPWRRGGLRWGFTSGGRGRWEKKSRQGKVFFFLGGNEGEREGSCRWRLRPFLPPHAPARLSCPQAPPARPPVPSHLLSPPCMCAAADGLRRCRCVLGHLLPPPAWRQAASPQGRASPSGCAGLCLSPSPGTVPSAHRRHVCRWSTLTAPGEKLL